MRHMVYAWCDLRTQALLLASMVMSNDSVLHCLHSLANRVCPCCHLHLGTWTQVRICVHVCYTVDNSISASGLDLWLEICRLAN